MIRLGLLLLCLLAPMAAAGQDTALTAAQTERYRALIAELRCVICKNQTIAESNAPLAEDMRALVSRQIGAGRSDAQIKTFLVARYGEWVLYRPRFQPSTYALWLGPVALLLMALVAAFWLWWRAAGRREPPPPASEAIDRLLEKHRDHSG